MKTNLGKQGMAQHNLQPISKQILSRVLVLSFFSIMLISCANVAKVLDLDSDLEMEMKALADINPDDNDLPSPLVIRLYELKDNKQFEQMEFYDIYERDEEILGKNLIARHVLKHFTPDSQRNEKMVLRNNTRFVGLFAEFSQYKNSKYRAVFEVSPHLDSKVKIILSGTELQLATVPVYPIDEFDSSMEKPEGVQVPESDKMPTTVDGVFANPS